MIDADVETAIKLVLDTGLTSAGISAIVAQSFNPTTQGASLLPNVIFTKITARRFGFQGQKYTRIPGVPDTYSKAEVYWLRPTYQLSGFMNQNPVDPNSLNAYDVLDTCAAILQSEEGRATFKLAGIGIDRISDVRTPRTLDDSDRFNMDANFDFVLSYRNELTTIIPSAQVVGVTERV